MFDSLSPNQKQLLYIGVPVVSVFALVSVLKKGNTTPGTTPATGVIAGTGSGTAIDAGQLATYESDLGAQLNSAVTALGNSQLASTSALGASQDAAAAALTAANEQTAGEIQAQVSALSAQLPHAQTNLNSANYPVVGPQGTSYDILGEISGAGGQYTGQNVGGGAPVYAYVNGQWQQDYNVKQLAVGTPLATPSTFQQNIVSGVYTGQL